MTGDHTTRNRLSPHEKASLKDDGAPDLRLKRILLGTFLTCFLVTLLFLLVEFGRDRDTFLALFDHDRFLEYADEEDSLLKERKSAILQSLNTELNQDKGAKDQENNRLLGKLDRLWQSFKRYVSPKQNQGVPQKPETRVADFLPIVGEFPPLRKVSKMEPEDVESPNEHAGENIADILALTHESRAIRDAAVGSENPAATLPVLSALGASDLVAAEPPPFDKGIIDARALSGFFDNLEPRGGVRTRGVAWRVHRKLTLEGGLDTTSVGETDTDLCDFGLRSIQALTFLRDYPGPGVAMGVSSIDSGYPLSYSIGLNYRLSPAMKLLFDYSHEFRNDHYIEYRGAWESSLMADYSKNRPDDVEDNSSIHSFFFGLHYLVREPDALIPLQTGFFYTTNMAAETFPSDVSMGFSVGGGYHRKGIQLGLSYRLRIWENPEETLLAVENLVPPEDIATRLSNQVLFYLHF